MISVLLSQRNISEYRLISEILDKVSFRINVEFNIIQWDCQQPIEAIIREIDFIDAAIIDVTAAGAIDVAKKLRHKYSSIQMLIVADSSISPITYLNPQIIPAALALKPFDKKTLENTINSFFDLFQKEDENANYYVIQSKNDKLRLPYDKIVYFEARDKRVYVRLHNIEYTTFDTVEGLVKKLPAFFIRCHRSFIVNLDYIDVIYYRQNIIVMVDDINVPLSRTYKSSVKEAVNNEK